MRIASLTGDDLPDLSRLYRQFRGEESCLEDMVNVYRRLRTDPSYILLAAREGSRMIGSVMGVLCEELYGRCRPFMVVEDLIVDQAHRRRGGGRLLMSAVEQEAAR